MVGDFSHAIVTIHNFHSLQDLPKKMWGKSVMHYEAREYTSRPRTCCTHSIVISVFNDQRFIIINSDKLLLSTEVLESIEKYAAEEGITILEE